MFQSTDILVPEHPVGKQHQDWSHYEVPQRVEQDYLRGQDKAVQWVSNTPQLLMSQTNAYWFTDSVT